MSNKIHTEVEVIKMNIYHIIYSLHLKVCKTHRVLLNTLKNSITKICMLKSAFKDLIAPKNYLIHFELISS